MAAAATGDENLSGWLLCCLVGAYFGDKAKSRETVLAEHALIRLGYLEEDRRLTDKGFRTARKRIDALDRRLF